MSSSEELLVIDFVMSVKLVGSSPTLNCRSGLDRFGGGAPSNISSYATVPFMLESVTLGAAQMRVVLFSILQSD